MFAAQMNGSVLSKKLRQTEPILGQLNIGSIYFRLNDAISSLVALAQLRRWISCAFVFMFSFSSIFWLNFFVSSAVVLGRLHRQLNCILGPILSLSQLRFSSIVSLFTFLV